MAIEWTDDLATGVGEIDEQHKELFGRVNSLLDACKAGKGKEEVEKTLDFLSSYVLEHFGTEEQMMRKHEYPNFDEHKVQHEAFIADVAKLREELSQGGAGVALIIRTNAAVVDWLLKHIRKTDKLMGGFLKSKVG
jgi:hemerythrin